MSAPPEPYFDHERLEVYREAVAFVGWLSAILEGAVRVGDVKDQLDRASTSVPLNIAEGNGKYAPKDRCRFFDYRPRFRTRMRGRSRRAGCQG